MWLRTLLGVVHIEWQWTTVTESENEALMKKLFGQSNLPNMMSPKAAIKATMYWIAIETARPPARSAA